MNRNNLVKLLISIIVCELAGAVGSIFTTPSINSWYISLVKPPFNPPNWIFAPVWTILFVLMGISLYLVWYNNFTVKNQIGNSKIKAWNSLSQKFFTGPLQKANIIIIFGVQLFLNVLWSIIFFGMHSPGLAFFEMIMLWVAIVYTIINFYRVSKASAYLLIPYILWVSFALVLNLSIFILN